jgi:GTP cyclohydrolase II
VHHAATFVHVPGPARDGETGAAVNLNRTVPVPIVAAMPVRTRVTVPLQFADGYATTAEIVTFTGLADGREHLALAFGEPGDQPLVRLHSECLTGDVFGSLRCDCGPQLREAAERITEAGGYLLYLRQEGRGIGLYAKLDAYALQDSGLDTYQANRALGRDEDERDYRPAAEMLADLGVTRISLLTNNPDKLQQMRAYGVEVTEVLPTAVHASAANVRYLAAKAAHTGHTIALPMAG